MATPSIPRRAYSLMANLSMFLEARKNGAVRRLNARPYEEKGGGRLTEPR